MVEGGSISRVANHHSQAVSAPISRVPSGASAVSMPSGLDHMDRNSAPDHVVRVLLGRLRGTVYYQLIMAASTLACAVYIFLKPVPTTWSDADVYVVLCQGVYVVLRIFVWMRSYITVYHCVPVCVPAFVYVCVRVCVSVRKLAIWFVHSILHRSRSFSHCAGSFFCSLILFWTPPAHTCTRTRLRYI